MKVKVNNDICLGCGACASTCEAVFEFGDNGIVVKTDQVPEEEIENAKAAIEGCPVGAITIENANNEK